MTALDNEVSNYVEWCFYVPRKLNIKPELNRNEPTTEPATILRETTYTL